MKYLLRQYLTLSAIHTTSSLASYKSMFSSLLVAAFSVASVAAFIPVNHDGFKERNLARFHDHHRSFLSSSLLSPFATTATPRPSVVRRRPVVGSCSPLSLSSSSTDDGDVIVNKTKKNKKKVTGVYARPSAAIEKGSGFYVPGLEGSRVRGFFGVLLVVLTFVNHDAGNDPSSYSFSASEFVALAYGALLVLQGLVEFGKESGFVAATTASDNDDVSTTTVADDGDSASGDRRKTVDQYASPEISSDDADDDAERSLLEGLRWAAVTLVALTPATHVMLLREKNDEDDAPTLLYGLGDFGGVDVATMTNRATAASEAALRTALESRGGRVAVTLDHPAAALMPENGRRCLLLQRIVVDENGGGGDRRYCVVVGSDQILEAFTKNDLRWLGRLAKHLETVLLASSGRRSSSSTK